ncbi:Uncharacterised protein [Streptococcus pseudoporcinus]|uniref:Uncharacterized protein n=1 Tax=Streptococcus pseudoporcinus TaxID=361101 RepID=A0A4U9Z255_9STRE|nr:hypothetical protein [Streptococcus pseudoporcinus]VTS33449.1 Uncharacterised protein [Streptococcus pseudoporcinus]
MKQIEKQIESYIVKLESYSPSLAELSKGQCDLLKQTKASTIYFEDFLNDLKGSVAIFKEE